MAASPSVAAPLKVMPLGDSITFGSGPGTGGYRTQLWKDFGSDPAKLVFYGSLEAGPPELGNKHTEGHPGFTIANEPGSGYGNLMDSIAGYLNPRVVPDVILLMIGTNDINRQFEVDQAPAKLDRLISLISDRSTGLRPNSKLIVANILPIDDLHNQFAWPGADFNRDRDVVTFNATIPGIVAVHRTRGENVFFADMNSSFTYADIADGLHPTLEGFDKLGDLWYGKIVEVVPEPGGLSLFSVSVSLWTIFRSRRQGSLRLKSPLVS